MQILFVTQEVPFAERNGAQKYSSAIVQAIVDLGHKVNVMSLDPAPSFAQIYEEVALFAGQRQRGLRTLLAAMPRMVSAGDTFVNRQLFDSLAQRADLIVFDHFASTAFVGRVRAKPWCYVAHNHEAASKRSFLAKVTGAAALVGHVQDYLKICWWERRILCRAGSVASISEGEHRMFRRVGARSSTVFPYLGDVLSPRAFDKIPVVVLVGTFKWTPKRVAMLEFVSRAYPALNREGIRLRIAGSFEQGDAENLRRQFPMLDLRPDFDQLADVLEGAWAGLVVDGAGGGFKMKSLDYVRFGIPIFGLADDLNHAHFVDGVNCIKANEVDALVERIVRGVREPAALSELAALAQRDFRLFFDRERLRLEVGKFLSLTSEAL